MPKDKNIHKVLVIGSGPIVIGQAAEFDYAGAQACRVLRAEGIRARVINMCTIKPLDEEMIVRAARECGRVVTCEEHSVVGGLGEAVAMVLSQKCPVLMRYVGVQVAQYMRDHDLCLEEFTEEWQAAVAAYEN